MDNKASPAQTSETPRTDELVSKLDRIGYGAPEQAAIALCDELERDLTASQASLAAERRDAARYRIAKEKGLIDGLDERELDAALPAKD